jgi:ferredoxin
MRIEVDRGVCIGAGNCVLTAAAVFDQDDDEGLVTLLQAEPAPPLYELVRRAAFLCPSGAIAVTD